MATVGSKILPPVRSMILFYDKTYDPFARFVGKIWPCLVLAGLVFSILASVQSDTSLLPV